MAQPTRGSVQFTVDPDSPGAAGATVPDDDPVESPLDVDEDVPDVPHDDREELDSGSDNL